MPRPFGGFSMKKLPSFVFILPLIIAGALAQDRNQSTNSFFDGSEATSFAVKNVTIQGEVQDPGPVDLSSLPLRSIAFKELAIENGQRVFKGAYFAGGYSLYDILSSKKFKKAPENTFSPPVDLYVVVENEKGDKAVFSWGEIYYRNSFDILITKTIQAINPARSKATWSLPGVPRLICAGDSINARFINSPTKITVRSFHGPVPKEKPKDIYSPELKIVSKTGSFTVADIASSVEKRTYLDVGYGHGMGFKGAQNVSGYLLKDVIASNWKPSSDMFGKWIAVASAKDGYRSVLSLSEIMNRSDNQDLLLLDQRDSPGSGRFTLYPAGDFFADRDVRAVEKIELMEAE
jgi:hypothetical protein